MLEGHRLDISVIASLSLAGALTTMGLTACMAPTGGPQTLLITNNPEPAAKVKPAGTLEPKTPTEATPSTSRSKANAPGDNNAGPGIGGGGPGGFEGNATDGGVPSTRGGTTPPGFATDSPGAKWSRTIPARRPRRSGPTTYARRSTSRGTSTSSCSTWTGPAKRRSCSCPIATRSSPLRRRRVKSCPGKAGRATSRSRRALRDHGELPGWAAPRLRPRAQLNTAPQA